MAITAIQNVGKFSSAASSVVVHLTTNTTATNTLLAAFCLPSGGSVVSVNDTISGRWIQHANSTSTGGAAPYPTGTTGAMAASVDADSAPTLPLTVSAGTAVAATLETSVVPFLPLTVTTGVNDEFVYTGDGGGGSPETFTVAPGTYRTQTDVATALNAAIGSVSGEAFSTKVTVTVVADYMTVSSLQATTLYPGITVVAGVNDNFHFTPISTGIPELFTIAAGSYDLTAMTNPSPNGGAMARATGSVSGEPFSTYFGVYENGGYVLIEEVVGRAGSDYNGDQLTTGTHDVLASLGYTSPAVVSGQVDGEFLFTMVTAGSAQNGNTIGPGAHDIAADIGLAITGTFSGGDDHAGGNDEFVYTPIATGVPETFVIAAGTYSTLADLVAAVDAAVGESSEAFSTKVTASDDGTVLILTEVVSGSAFNGDTISFGLDDVAADLGFTGNPDTFAGGEDDGPASGLGPGGAVEVWGSRGIQGGNASVTAVFSTASVGCNVSEWSGLPFMSIMDSWSQNLGTGTTITPQTVSPRTTGDLVFVAANGSASVSAPAGYTSLSIPGDMSYSAGYQILSGSVVTATHFNQAAASMWSCVEAAFLPANASGGPWAWNTNVGFNPLSQFPECLVQMSTAQNYLASFQGVGIWTDVSPYVQSMTLGPIGRQHELDRVQATSGQLVMNGRDGSLNPWNTQSFLYPGGLDPQTPIKCTASWNGQTSPIAYLYAQSFDPNIIDAVNSTVTISAYDVLQTLSLGYLSNNNYAQAVLAGN